MTELPRNRLRKIAPGNWTTDDTDADWQVVDGGGGRPDFFNPPVGTAWANAVGPVAPLQYRFDADGMVHVEGELAKVDQPLGDFGSPVFILPEGYRPLAKWVDPTGNWAVWEDTAPTGIEPDLRGMLVWQGRSSPGIPILRQSISLQFLADAA